MQAVKVRIAMFEICKAQQDKETVIYYQGHCVYKNKCIVLSLSSIHDKIYQAYRSFNTTIVAKILRHTFFVCSYVSQQPHLSF